MIFSVILEQRAITVVVSQPDTLKHCVASRFAPFQPVIHNDLLSTIDAVDRINLCL